MGVSMYYGDIAPEAKENFAASATNKEPISDLTQFQQYNLKFNNYGNPCELWQVPLDGSSVPIDLNNLGNIGLWSMEQSSEVGTIGEDDLLTYKFETPIVLTLTTNAGNYTSQGFTLTFDLDNEIYPKDLSIEWYRDNELLGTGDYTPISAFYFCKNPDGVDVSLYNKIVITFRSLNMPLNRLRLRAIDFGYGTVFGEDNFTSVKQIQQINPISDELPINTCDFTFQSDDDIQYNFQSKQPISVYFSGNLISTNFITSSERKASRIWDVKSEDYKGLLDKLTFYGGMYDDELAENIISDICGNKIPYTLADSLKNRRVSGWLPIAKGRPSLQQVLFAIGAIVDTANSDKLNIKELPTEVSQTITKSRIKEGQTFKQGNIVTKVSLTAHTYIPDTNTQNAVEIFKNHEIGDNIVVIFDNPIVFDTLNITGGNIVSGVGNCNYVVVNIIDTVNSLTGQPYIDTTSEKFIVNDLVPANTIENIKSIDKATLISNNPIEEGSEIKCIDNILQKCYNYFIEVDTMNLEIVNGWRTVEYGQKIYDDIVNVGDKIIAESQFTNNKQGTILTTSYGLNGSKIFKECEVLLD